MSVVTWVILGLLSGLAAAIYLLVSITSKNAKRQAELEITKQQVSDDARKYKKAQEIYSKPSGDRKSVIDRL